MNALKTFAKSDYYVMPVYDFEIVVLGFLRLILIVLTTLANVFVVAYFLGRRHRGKSTSLVFISIAISDTLTGIILLPNSIYVYIRKNEDLSYAWCYAYMHTRLYFSQVFHTISIWQTVLLGVQRYMCVCHPFIAGRWCSFGKTFVAIICVYVIAFVIHINHLLDEKTGFNDCRWVTETPCVASCIYIWICIVFMHFTPCLTLINLTTKTLLGLRKAGRRVSSMMPGTSGQRLSRDKIITITATLVVIVFLIPELPYCFYRLVFVINKHLGTSLASKENHIFVAVYEIALIISFHCNFWIYCVMMRDFRQLIQRLVTCRTVKHGLSRLRSFSRSSRSSGCPSAVTSVSRTSSVASRNRILSNRTTTYSTQSETAHALVQLPMRSVASPSTCRYAEPPSVDNAEDLVDDVFV